MKYSDIAWELRLEMYVKDPIRKLLGQKTSSQLIGEALETGVDREKLDDLIEELEALADEMENSAKAHPDTAHLKIDRLHTETQ